MLGVEKIKKAYFADYGYRYDPGNLSVTYRSEYRYIKDWVEPGSRILDLACGDGSLGLLLIKNKNCDVYGLEISEEGTKIACAKGVKANICDIDEKIDFPDKSFDYVIINVTLQMVYRPAYVFQEALRVGRRVIVSFPNFGHWYARMELMFLGRFPRYLLYGYEWCNTRHIHFFSYKDFIEFALSRKAKIIKCKRLDIDGATETIFSKIWPNLFSKLCIIMLEPE